MWTAIFPVFLIIALGAAIRHYGWLTPGFFDAVEKYSYNVAFPALLFTGTARLVFDAQLLADLALATLLPTLLVLLLTLVLLLAWVHLTRAARSSVVQGAVRPNSYFGIAVAGLLFDPQTAALVMAAIALCLPFLNLIAVLVLSWWSGTKTSVATVGKSIACNPIILASVVGGLVGAEHIALPASLISALDIIGKSALALGLLSVGGGLIFSRQEVHPLALGLTSVLKLLALPLIAAKVCLMVGLSGPVALAGCFFCALPTAPNAYIMARQMGGDARLMASLVTLQTLLAVVTIPLSGHFLPWLS